MVYTTKKTFICFTIHSRLDDGLLTQDLAGLDDGLLTQDLAGEPGKNASYLCWEMLYHC